MNADNNFELICASLDDPAIRDALRDAIAETMPVNLMVLLGLDLPEVKSPKPKTFAGIMTKKFKPEKPIGFQRKKPIGFASHVPVPKDQTLSCVGFANSKLNAPSSEIPICRDVEYTRERESELTGGYWDEELGEYIRCQLNQNGGR